MANIFIAFFNGVEDEGNPNALPIFYESFIKEMDKVGNDLYVIAHHYWGVDFGEIDVELEQQIKKFDPDVCFIFNNSFYDLANVVDCPIIIYEVDSPIYFSNKEKLCRNPERYLYFAAQTSSIATIHDEFGVSKEKIFYIPFFSEVHADDREPTINISFIGSKFQPNPRTLPNRFTNSNPSKEERELFAKCIEEITRNPQITVRELIFKLQILSEKVAINLSIPDILMYLSGEKRIHVLSAIVDLGLELYGNENWAKDYYYDYRLNLAFNYKKVYSLKHNQDIYNSSKIGISVAHVQAKTGFPWRIMDIMASNACLVSDYHEDFERLFKGVPIPTFSSEYEAREICLKLLADEKQRQEIVAQCQAIVDSKYRFKHLLEKMEEYSGVIMHV